MIKVLFFMMYLIAYAQLLEVKVDDISKWANNPFENSSGFDGTHKTPVYIINSQIIFQRIVGLHLMSYPLSGSMIFFKIFDEQLLVMF